MGVHTKLKFWREKPPLQKTSLLDLKFEKERTNGEEKEEKRGKETVKATAREFGYYNSASSCSLNSNPNERNGNCLSEVDASETRLCPFWPTLSSQDSNSNGSSVTTPTRNNISRNNSPLKFPKEERDAPVTLDEVEETPETSFHSDSGASSLYSLPSVSNEHMYYSGVGLPASIYDSHIDCKNPTQSQPLFFPEPNEQLRRSKSEPHSENPTIQNLIEMMASDNDNERRFAVSELRILTKSFTLNRMQISNEGGVPPLITLLESPDPHTVELAIVTIHNLSLTHEIATQLIESGVSQPLVRVLETGSQAARENAAAAIFQLTKPPLNLNRRLHPSDKLNSLRASVTLGDCGACECLLRLLPSASMRGMKDACLALFDLCSEPANLVRVLQEGGVKTLLDCLENPLCNSDDGENLVEKIVSVLAKIAKNEKGLDDIFANEGLERLEWILEAGNVKQRSKEDVLSILLCFARRNQTYCEEIRCLGIKLAVMALVRSGSPKAKAKAKELLEYIH